MGAEQGEDEDAAEEQEGEGERTGEEIPEGALAENERLHLSLIHI